MSEVWIFTLASVVLVSVISLVGILAFSLKDKILRKLLILFVSFSAGALLGDAFIHLLPEIVEEEGFTLVISLFILLGIFVFFIVEKVINWRHCHDIACETHSQSFTYMNLVGDGVHNFIDGMVIAGSYLVSIHLGFATTIAVLFHEVPQEIGDFAVLIYGGFKKSKALMYNLLAASFAIIGAVIMLALETVVSSLPIFLVPFTVGGFIYIAGSDLIPELHKEVRPWVSLAQIIALISGVAVMLLLLVFE
jgi:zinc and cadmium transporter